MTLSDIPLKNSDLMPALFIGHGNPMNTIMDNEYSRAWKEVAGKIEEPSAILCISAHWLTPGKTLVTMESHPRTIHDFMGFPKELFDQQYPAPGAVAFALNTKNNVSFADVEEDHEWGYDHGTWSVLKNMYPNADIPVFQLSIDYNKDLYWHVQLAKDLKFLRKKGVLILGSGNVVHNLRMLNFKANQPFDWAVEFDEFVKHAVNNRDVQSLTGIEQLGELARMAHPSHDHYLPLLYTMGVLDEKEDISFFTDEFDMGSVSMRSFISHQ